MKDYYGILELSPNATPDEIKAQYRLMLNAWHPDKHSNPEHKAKAEGRTKEITEAYSVLSDPIKRAQYDRERSSQSSYSNDSERRRSEEAERKRRAEEAETSYQRAENEQRRQEQAEANKRRAEYERQQREKAEAERQREYERQRQEQAKTARQRAEYEQFEAADRKFTAYIQKVSAVFLVTFVIGAYVAVTTGDKNNLLILAIIITITGVAAFVLRLTEARS